MEFTLLQALILGVIQGITEWIPLSSSGILAFVMSNFFGITKLGLLIEAALFFHLGTFFAALIYFRKDVIKLIGTLFNYKYSDLKHKKILNFIIISTIISGILGLVILKTLFSFEQQLELTGKTISFFVGILLLFTGVIQLKIKDRGLRQARDIKTQDSFLLGVTQGLSVLPGLSRSGITVSTLLLKKFNDTTALKLSFLMSLPVILIGNIFLSWEDVVFTSTALYGLLAAFVFGILTIHLLMSLSRKINFGWFALLFALLMMISVLI